ncbi:hypothetical protein K9M74_00065 [Candidatus Woesearchaeota archaeon]|nr:hypothetical protein [Candidatus Woesearchaeota archaeon]
MSQEKIVPSPNKYLSHGNIAEIIALKMYAPAHKVSDSSYIRQVAASLFLRPETLAYYWSEEYTPSRETKSKIPQKEETKKEWIQDNLSSVKSGKTKRLPSKKKEDTLQTTSKKPYLVSSPEKKSMSKKVSLHSDDDSIDALLKNDVESGDVSVADMVKHESNVLSTPESVDETMEFLDYARLHVAKNYKTSFLFVLRRAYQGVPVKTIVEELSKQDFGRFSENYITYQLEYKQKLLGASSIDALYNKIYKGISFSSKEK